MVWFQFSDAGITFKPHTLGEYLTKHGIFPLFTQIYLKFSQVANNFFPDYKSTIGSLAKIWKIQKEYWPKKKNNKKTTQPFVFVSLRGLCFALWDVFVCLCVSLCICLCLCVVCSENMLWTSLYVAVPLSLWEQQNMRPCKTSHATFCFHRNMYNLHIL